ncbi:ROK family protein [Jatrophihabitans sp. YIM 134969]
MDSTAALSSRRARSRGALLHAVERGPGLTRAELATRTGLSTSAVAAGVADLIAAGLAVEQTVRTPVRGRGRPPTIIRSARPDGRVVGVDFGHSHVRVALASADGTVLQEAAGVVDVDAHAEQALDLAGELVETVLDRAGVPREQVRAVGAGIPGPLHPTGKVASPTILHSWVDLDPAAELQRRLGHPVAVENDADMGAVGERRFGSAAGFRDFIYVKASHGIGAGIVLGGRIFRGATGTAGEIGHTQLSGSANRCRCGKQGCLEAAVSVTEVRRQLEHTHLRPLEEDEAIPSRVLEDPVGARILVDAGRVVGRIVADGCNWLNPQAVILGGELGLSGSAFVEGVRDSLDRYAQSSVAAAVTVLPGALGVRSELMGAIAVAWDHAAR